MRFSKMLIPTLREDPGEAEVISHRLMLRAGMIRKLTAGFYTYLPMGYRVMKKVEAIVREEMDRVGAQEILMPIMQPAELWQETGRWSQYGKELMRLTDRHNREFCLGPTHEEVVTDLIRREVRSYRQLPLILYQIHSKFRDEIRPRFGLMRGREFIMKDAYSFDRDEAGAEVNYRKLYEAYERIFSRCGLAYRAVEADTGLIGGRFSHEFMVVAETGEEGIVLCTSCTYAANVERAACRTVENLCPRCSGPLVFKKGIEVGHVFMLGTKYSEAMSALFLNQAGEEVPCVMGCYGIGIGRTVAAAIEQNHDRDGIIWPAPLAPFQVWVLPVNMEKESVRKTSEEVYHSLRAEGLEVVIDDREERPGVKFKDADLIGVPYQVIVGEKNLEKGLVEVKERRGGERRTFPPEKVGSTLVRFLGEFPSIISTVF